MSELKFSSNKSSRILDESLQVRRPGNLLQLTEGEIIFEIDYSGVLSFDGENPIGEFQRVVLFQLLRFSEALDLNSLQQMSWREFENFMRDTNTTASIPIEKNYQAEKEFNELKKILPAPLKAFRAFELQLTQFKSIEGASFIDCCAFFQDLCDELVSQKIIPLGINPYSWLVKQKKLIWEIDPTISTSPHEIETLMAVSKQIQGVNDVKMVARANESDMMPDKILLQVI